MGSTMSSVARAERWRQESELLTQQAADEASPGRSRAASLEFEDDVPALDVYSGPLLGRALPCCARARSPPTRQEVMMRAMRARVCAGCALVAALVLALEIAARLIPAVADVRDGVLLAGRIAVQSVVGALQKG